MIRTQAAAVATAMLMSITGIAVAQGSGGGGSKAAAHTRSRAAAAAHRAAAARATEAARDTSGAKQVNKFMSYEPGKKQVDLKVTSALGSANGGMNFNGGFRGNTTITIPEGWSVDIHFTNADAIPHSAILIPAKFPLPAAPSTPAFPRAYTKDVTGGIPTGGTDEMMFTAKPAGHYLIACGVPGHAPSGMYIAFDVSASAATPSYVSK